MLLTVEDLTVARGGLPVLEGVAFALGPGEALVLRGPNGIGKTTLLRTVAGLQPALAGRIGAEDDTVAYAGHADGVKSALTVEETLWFWAEIFGAQEIGPALAAFDLEDLRDRPAGNLSAGQRRRLGLARMLVTGRPVWAMDEPTVSLDTASVGLFAAAIGVHLAAGGAALIATHIDLGLGAQTLDLTPFKAQAPRDAFDAAFV